jgi:phosphatidyl-myo-inositol dimannoside synthase
MPEGANVLVLATDAFGGQGGIAQYNRDFLGSLAACNCSTIFVFTRHSPGSCDLPDGIEQRVPLGGRSGFAAAAVTWALFRPVDIIFCGHINLAPLAAVIAQLRGAKVVLQAHGIEVWKTPKPLWIAAAETSDLILCVSRHTRQAVLDWARIAPERAVVVANTVGDAFTPGDGAAFRRSVGLESRKLLLTVGRIDSREQYKGHDRVISAMPGLIAAGHDVIYLIVGSGDDRPRLESITAAAGVSDRVRFLGELQTDQLVEAYQAADLFVMPSSGEGFGISFLEAMACGTPALGLNVGGTRDALAEGELGAAVSESEFDGALHSLLSRPKPDGSALSVAVRARFGRTEFQSSVENVMFRLGFAQLGSQPLHKDMQPRSHRRYDTLTLAN